jgi:hypothetical protein
MTGEGNQRRREGEWKTIKISQWNLTYVPIAIACLNDATMLLVLRTGLGNLDAAETPIKASKVTCEIMTIKIKPTSNS